MRNKIILGGAAGTALIMFILFSFQCSTGGKGELSAVDKVKRGEYLVATSGCNDCHTPKIYTDTGIMIDSTRFLSGFQADEKLPEVPNDLTGPGEWGAITNASFTAWVGPWGTSFAANLTPDMVTGSGAWTEQSFIAAMRTGKHLGAGRDILPPMPWPNIAQMTDEDLAAIFAYLRSLKPIENMVPPPVPPEGTIEAR